MASPTVDIGTLIEFPPERHGRPCLAGTGMSVARVARLFRAGKSAEQIQADYPDIALGHFYAAIAYYLSNRAAVDAAINADDAEAEALHEQHRASTQQAS